MLSPASFYLTIDDLPLDRFIAVLCEGDFDALIRPGSGISATPETLANVWAGIFLEYLDASNHNQTKYKIYLNRDIKVLDARLAQIETLILILRTTKHAEAVDLLRAKGNEDLLYPFDDDDAYISDLNITFDRSRELKIDRDLKGIELEELEKSEDALQASQPDRKANKTMFLNILARLATFKHVAIIRTSEITVAEFCAMFMEYLDHQKNLQSTNTKHR